MRRIEAILNSIHLARETAQVSRGYDLNLSGEFSRRDFSESFLATLDGIDAQSKHLLNESTHLFALAHKADRLY